MITQIDDALPDMQEQFFKALFAERISLEALYEEIRALLVSDNNQDNKVFVDRYFITGNYSITEELSKSIAILIINILKIVLLEMGKSLLDVFEDDITIWRKLKNFESIDDIRYWLCNIISTIRVYLGENVKTRDSRIAEDIKKIISQRYQEQITVNDIVEYIYMSPSHANNIFKKEAGKSIFDYLTEYRMEKAKSLLSDPYSRIYLVADSVGYVNKSHFCLLFKKYTGVTPGMYKKQGCSMKAVMC